MSVVQECSESLEWSRFLIMIDVFGMVVGSRRHGPGRGKGPLWAARKDGTEKDGARGKGGGGGGRGDWGAMGRQGSRAGQWDLAKLTTAMMMGMVGLWDDGGERGQGDDEWGGERTSVNEQQRGARKEERGRDKQKENIN